MAGLVTPYAKYDMNPRGIELEILHSSFIKAQLLARAEVIKAAFVAIAPVGKISDGDKHPGAYRDSLRIYESTQPSPRGGSRAVVHVVSMDPLGAHKEFGTVRTVQNVAPTPRDSFEASLIGGAEDAPRVAGAVRVEGSHALLRALDVARSF